MSFPGFPDGLDPGWWRIAQATPPVFPLVGTLDGTTSTIAVALPFAAPSNPPPLAGQQVSGTGIPALSTVVSVGASSFAISATTTATGPQQLTIGAEPVTVAEANTWAINENPDNNATLIPDLIQATRELVEGPELKRALMLQSKCIYFMGFPWSGYYSLAIRGMGLNPWWFPLAQGIIKLPYPPLQSIVSVKYVDTNGTLQTISPSLYLSQANATPGMLQPAYGTIWPVARPQLDAVQITFACGYGAFASNIPASTRLGMRAIVAANYENREAYMQGQPLIMTPMARSFLDVENYGFYG